MEEGLEVRGRLSWSLLTVFQVAGSHVHHLVVLSVAAKSHGNVILKHTQSDCDLACWEFDQVITELLDIMVSLSGIILPPRLTVRSSESGL